MRVGDRFYCDHAATTPVSEAVVRVMQPWLADKFQNPSSLYLGGQSARRAIDEARDIVAAALGCLPGEIVFTASGTEAANLAIIGSALAAMDGGRKRVLISAGEHEAVLNTAAALRKLGYDPQLVPLSIAGGVDEGRLSEVMGPDVLLVAAMSANNETGIANNSSAIRELCRQFGAHYFCDAVSTFGLTGGTNEADFVAISAHKIYGPKGIGALMIRSGTVCSPIIAGGGQEHERRAGTEFVAGIVGFAATVRDAFADSSRAQRIQAVRDQFVTELTSSGIPISLTQHSALPGHAHFRIEGAASETMLINLDRLGVEAAAGSACSSGSIEPSHVLLAMGWSESQARSALRFSFGMHSSPEDVAPIVNRICEAASVTLGSSGKSDTHG